MAIGNPAVANISKATTRTTSQSKLQNFLCRYFYFTMSLVFAATVLIGFSRTVDSNLFHANPPRPTLLWFHGTAFSLWVVFFILQSALVRVKKISVHRLLGWFGLALAAIMAVLGTVIAVIMARFDTSILHQADAKPFISIPFVDMLIFGVCVALAIYWRKKPDFHRRLLFLATCNLMDAPFGRFDVLFNNALFYPALDTFILCGLLRDWYVDGRVHKLYLYALPPILLLHAAAVFTWRVNPTWWQSITTAILGS
jgi:FtsH-binding integral membrane protein